MFIHCYTFELSSIYHINLNKFFVFYTVCINDYKLYVAILFINQLKTAKKIVQIF